MRRTKDQMIPLVDLYKNRKCSQAEFCNRHNISKAVLQYWISQINNDLTSIPESKVFQSIEISRESNVEFIEIRTKAGLEIRIPV